MSTSFLDNLQETFLDPNFDMAELHRLLNQTTVYLKELKLKTESKDPEIREEALRESVELQGILAKKMKELSEKSGLTAEQLAEISVDPTKIPREHWNFIQQMKTRFDQIQNPPAKPTLKLKPRKSYV